MLQTLVFLSLALVFLWLVRLLFRFVRLMTYRCLNVLLVPALWWDRTRELLEWLLEASQPLEFLAPDATEEQTWCADHPRLMREVAGASVTSGVAGTRLRRRARWVRALQDDLGGRFGVVREVLSGRWEPDLPTDYDTDVLRYVASSVENGVRILGGGFTGVGPEVPEETGFYLLVASPEGDDVVFPHLLGHLRQHALFRKRDSGLLLGLRSRAIDWCRARGFASWVADMAVCSAVSLAIEPSCHELAAASRVESSLAETPLLSAWQ